MAIRGLQVLYNLILKDIVKGSGQASGILSIGKDVRKLADKKLQRYITTAKKQGVDLDSLSEQEIKYMLEMNRPKGPTIGGHQIIDASSSEGQGITRNLFNMLDRQSGKNVIKGKFGKPFSQEVDDIADKKVIEQMYRTSGPRSLDEDAGYLAEFIAEDAGKVLDDLPIKEQTKFIERAKNALRKNVKQYQPEEVVTVDSVITDIKKLEPMESMKEANRVLRGEGKYKNLSKVDREKIINDESVTDHIFERNIIDETEDFAQGGRTGLSYLLAEDTNERVPLKDGYSPGRRNFLKIMGGLAALPVVGKLFKFAKPAAKVAKDLTQVPIKTGVDGMPLWFKPLVNKVIKEGDDVSKNYAIKEREIIHRAELPNSKTSVIVEQDLDTGNVIVDIGTGKHGFPDGHLGQPVRLEYKAAEVIEPSTTGGGYMTKGGENVYPGLSKGAQQADQIPGSKGMKTKEEFWVEEAEFTGGHPENVKFEETTIEKFGDHGSNFDEVEMFATGKLKKSKPTKKAEKLEYEIGKAEADASAAADMADDFASGGLARMLGE